MNKESAFDVWWLKPIGWLGSHFYIVLAMWGWLFCIAFIFNNEAFWKLLAFSCIPGVVACWFITIIYSPANQYRISNKLKPYFSGRRYTWKIIGPQYTSMKRSGILTPESYGKYGDNLIGVEVSGEVLPMAFIGVSGCVTWIELQRTFPHIIIDSTKDNKSLKNIRTESGAKLHEISLEGNFPSYFKVYQEDNKQVLTLQILSPDRMEYLIDQLGEFSIEIQGNYLRLYSPNAQKSSIHFRAYLDAIKNLQDGFKVNRLNIIH